MTNRILGIDPGIANTGWAILDLATEKLIDIGLIQTQPKKDISDRLSVITNELINKIQLVDIVAVEKVFFHRNAPSTLSTAYVIGNILYQAKQYEKQIYEIRPQGAKMSLGLKGNASKNEVGKAISNRFGKAFNRHAADAIAIALAIKSSGGGV